MAREALSEVRKEVDLKIGAMANSKWKTLTLLPLPKQVMVTRSQEQNYSKNIN